VYTFPTMSSTTRGVSVVSLGQSLAITSAFSASLPASTTAAVSIVPSGYTAVTPVASVSGTSVTYALSVAYDVVHTGTVTLSYGAAQRAYSWAAGTLTVAHIYTFPSAFSYSGTANGYGTGIHLKQSKAGALTLTFTGGDMLHSSVFATQVEYVKFAQGGVDTTIAAASLACSDPLETVTVSSITPASTTDLTLKVKLRGPDGALSSEITAIMPSAQILIAGPEWQNYILYNGGRVANPRWQTQHADFARPALGTLSAQYHTFIRAVVDDTLYLTSSGDAWNPSTGVANDMKLKVAYQGPDGALQNNLVSSAYVAPTWGEGNNLDRGIYAVNGTFWRPYWDSANIGGFIKWGYKYSVTALSVGVCRYAKPVSGVTYQLWGFSSNSFTGGTLLVTLNGDSASNVNQGLSGFGVDYVWTTLTVTGAFTHYEFKASVGGTQHHMWPVLLGAS